ncbi:hypothetical protein Pelo_3009 [Pelomyxa schiedti]|nr:hypothetical protein Pelo_3009 [Pelomyxa schiedti]
MNAVFDLSCSALGTCQYPEHRSSSVKKAFPASVDRHSSICVPFLTSTPAVFAIPRSAANATGICSTTCWRAG